MRSGFRTIIDRCMNNIEFKAQSIVAEKDCNSGCYTFGLADHPTDVNQYVVLSRAFEFDEQDIKLGMDSEYTEVGGVNMLGYHICNQVVVSERDIILELSNRSIDCTIKIDTSSIVVSDEAIECLKYILQERLIVTNLLQN